MAEEFSQCILTKVVAQICQMVGFEKIMTTPLLVLTDILKEFILKLGRIAKKSGEHCGHSVIDLRDLSLAFHVCGILPGELTEFLKLISPLPESVTVPQFPVTGTIKNAITPHNSSDVDDLIEIENVHPNSGVNVNDSRETLKIKISFSKIQEAREAKKSKNKKNKQKRKKKKRKKQRSLSV